MAKELTSADDSLVVEAWLEEANVLIKTGDGRDFRSAWKIFNEAVSTMKKAKGPRHPDVAWAYFTFAENLVYARSHRFKTGLSPAALYDLALEIQEESCPESLDTAFTLARIGASHGVQYLGLAEPGFAYFDRAIAIVEKLGGSDNPRLWWFYYHYAVSIEDGEEQDEDSAMRYYEGAAEISKKSGEIDEQRDRLIESGIAKMQERFAKRKPVHS